MKNRIELAHGGGGTLSSELIDKEIVSRFGDGPLKGLPDLFSHLQAAVFEWFPGKPFSLDNYNSLKIDSTCKQSNCEPTSIEKIVPFYIGNKGMQKNYDTYRKTARR